MKYKATHENGSVLYLDSDADGGDNYDPSDRAFFGGKGWTSLDEDWKVEPIIELPTNLCAIVRIGRYTYWLGPEDKWIDATGDTWAVWALNENVKDAGGFEVIFGGIAPEDTGL